MKALDTNETSYQREFAENYCIEQYVPFFSIDLGRQELRKKAIAKTIEV